MQTLDLYHSQNWQLLGGFHRHLHLFNECGCVMVKSISWLVYVGFVRGISTTRRCICAVDNRIKFSVIHPCLYPDWKAVSAYTKGAPIISIQAATAPSNAFISLTGAGIPSVIISTYILSRWKHLNSQERISFYVITTSIMITSLIWSITEACLCCAYDCH